MLSIRKIGVISRTYRHLNRYRQILAVLFKYGFGNIIERLKIDQYIEVGLQMISKKPREPDERLTRAERMRMALEELGPTYIKLGQVLSTRPDLISMDLVKELAKLQDKVPPFSFHKAREIIEDELEGELSDFFEYLDEEPLASASIGQVHVGRLKEGEKVAVKIQRPNIRKIVEVDLEIMLHLATLMESHIEEIALHRPVKIVEEFARTLEKEIDYRIEATNMETVARHFIEDRFVYVPKVFHDHTTTRVLTTEFIKGIKVSEIETLDQTGLDRKEITANGADIILKQVIELGFFHADPHPGNIFVLPDNVICLIDFGMVGRVSRRIREVFIDLIDSIVHRDEAKTTQAILKLTIREEDPDLYQLEKEVADFITLHLYKPLKDIEIGKLLQNLMEIAIHHRLRIPSEIFLMMKALGTVEGVARGLDPDFDLISKATPYIVRAKMERFTPQRIADNVISMTSEIVDFFQQFPKDLLDIAYMLKKNRLKISVVQQGLETQLATYDQISNRLSFSIIIAALIVGSALIVISEIPPFFYGISLIGIIGFLAAVVMGIWLLVAIIRKGRL
jgi:ubiquinone biosynthesis protein